MPELSGRGKKAARELKARDYVDNGGAASNHKPVAERDAGSLLKLIWDNWQLVFRNTPGNAERSLVSELRVWRKTSGRIRKNISSEDAYRALDSASRLLAAVSAPQSEELDWLKRELLRVQLDAQDREEDLQAGRLTARSRTAGSKAGPRDLPTDGHEVTSGGRKRLRLWAIPARPRSSA